MTLVLIYFPGSRGEPGCSSAALEGTGAPRGERFASRRVCVEVTLGPQRQSFWRWLRPPAPGPGLVPGRRGGPVQRGRAARRYRCPGATPGKGGGAGGALAAVRALAAVGLYVRLAVVSGLFFWGEKSLSNLLHMFSREGFWRVAGAGVPKLCDLQPPRGPCITHDYVYQLQKPPEASALGPWSNSSRSSPVSHTRCREMVFLFTLPGSLSAQFQAAVM